MLRTLDRASRHPLIVIGVLTAVFAATYLAGTAITTGPEGPLVQGDARFYFAYLPSIVIDRDLDLTREFDILFPGHDHPRGLDRPLNPFPMHPALLWLPGYLAGLAIDAATSGLSTNQPLGFGPAASWGAALFGILAAGLACLATFFFVAKVFDRRTSLVASILTWLGTAAVYYTLITPLYSHTVAWAAVAAMFALLPIDRQEEASWRWLIVGVAGGFAVGARLQDLPLLAVPGLVLLSNSSGNWRTLARAGSRWSLGLFLGYLPQGINWYLMYRSFIPVEPQLDIADHVTSPAGFRLWEILLSTGYQGWWSWSPLVPLCLVGSAVIWRTGSTTNRAVLLGAIVGLAGMLFLDVIHPYGPGASFGGRRYVSVTPLLALGLAGLLGGGEERVPPGRGYGRALWPAATLAAWQLVVLLSYELLVIRHGVYPTLAETVRHALGGGAP